MSTVKFKLLYQDCNLCCVMTDSINKHSSANRWQEFALSRHGDINLPIAMQWGAASVRSEFVQTACMNWEHQIFSHMLA